MRKQMIQARVTPEEMNVIKEKASQSGMTASDYLRAVALGTQIQETGNSREIMSELCRMYTIVNQMEETEEREQLLERMNDVCRYLKS